MGHQQTLLSSPFPYIYSFSSRVVGLNIRNVLVLVKVGSYNCPANINCVRTKQLINEQFKEILKFLRIRFLNIVEGGRSCSHFELTISNLTTFFSPSSL